LCRHSELLPTAQTPTITFPPSSIPSTTSKIYIGANISSKTIEFDPNFEGQEHSFFQLTWGLQPNAASRKINEPFALISITPEQIYKASDFFKKQVLSIPDTRPVLTLARPATTCKN